MSGGIKHDQGKLPLDLYVWLPPRPTLAVCRVFEWAGTGGKYEPLNYKKGLSRRRLLRSALRHLFSYLVGQDKDPQSGESHLAHVACCVLMCMENIEDGLGEDDRFKGLAALYETPPDVPVQQDTKTWPSAAALKAALIRGAQ